MYIWFWFAHVRAALNIFIAKQNHGKYACKVLDEKKKQTKIYTMTTFSKVYTFIIRISI